jgi:hypothetical protein
MHTTRRQFLGTAAALAATPVLRAAQPQSNVSDLLARWKSAKVSAVSGDNHHSMHTYYLTSPESPDGKSVVFYASVAANGHEGEIRVRDRASGKETVLVRGLSTEDAHRVALQQWVSGGKRVAYHNVLPSGEWVVCVVNADGSDERILARNRQLAFGQPTGDVVPMYGMHWNPGTHRDCELANVSTGEITTTSLTADGFKAKYPDWVKKMFDDKPISIFFPTISPDGTRVFCKIASPAGGDFRSKQASTRFGLLCYDLKDSKYLSLTEKWGHPAWHPNSKDILDVGGIVIDSTTGKSRRLPGDWRYPGSHPSYSPDGKLFTTDAMVGYEPFNDKKGWWGIVVGNAETGESVMVHKFDHSKGAKSWRISHPHPSFSPDGKRIYFNVSDGDWTRLHVADIA